MEQPSQPSKPNLQIHSAKRSEPGLLRQQNEDYAGLIEPAISMLAEKSGCLYVVADGSGATIQGVPTSQYVVERLLSEYYLYPDQPPGPRLQMLIHRLGEELTGFALENPASRISATLVAAVIKNNKLTVAGVGDTRAFLIHDDSAQQIARDPNQLSELARRGAVSVEEVQNTAQIGLARSLGGRSGVEVDLFEEIPLFPGDLLLLCTDGLTRYIDDEQLVEWTSTGSPETICRRLIDHANASGGEDNTTVLVIQIGEPERPELVQAPVVEPVQPEQPEEELADLVLKTETANETDTAPAAQSPGQPKTRTGREMRILAASVGGMVLICLVLAALLAVQRFGSPVAPASVERASPTATITPVQIVLKVEPSSTPPILPSATLAAATNVAPTEPAVPQPSQTPTLDPTPTLSVGVEDPRFCVSEVQPGEGLFAIARRFEIPYDREGDYYYFAACDAEALTCTGKEELISNHQAIFPGWFVRVSEIDQARCELGGGLWVSLEE